MSENQEQDLEELSHNADMKQLEEQRDRALREGITLGVEAKKFLTSDLADYIRNVAEVKMLDAQRKLSKVDPTDVKTIIKLQTVIVQFEHFENCLAEMVAAGDTAYQLYLIDNTPE